MLEYYEPCLNLSFPENFNIMGTIVSLNDPGSEKTITVCVAIDHKAILGNYDNYRLFAGNTLLDFPKNMDMDDITRTCTMAHGQLILQTRFGEDVQAGKPQTDRSRFVGNKGF